MKTYEQLRAERQALAIERDRHEREGRYDERDALTARIAELWDEMGRAPVGSPTTRKTFLHTNQRTNGGIA